MKLGQWAHHVFYGRMKKGRAIFTLGAFILMCMIAFVYLYPFLYMVVTAFKSTDDISDKTVQWIPRTLVFYNFTNAFERLDYGKHFLISLCLTAFCMVVKVFVCSFIAYGFARFHFVGKKLLFTIVLLSMIIPVQTLLLPQYILFAQYKWIGGYLPLTIPQLTGFGLRGGVFIFLFRQFFLSTPKSLEEAAKLDGCGHFRTYASITLPTAQSAIIIVVVLSLVWSWNEYYEPTIYLSNFEKWPLPSMLDKLYDIYNAYTGSTTSDPSQLIRDMRTMNVETLKATMVTKGTLMAATFLVILPVLVAYGFLQKRFIQGIERSGLVD